MVERRTPYREVLGSNPTKVTVFTAHLLLRVLVNAQEAMADWDVKPQYKHVMVYNVRCSIN